MADKYPAFEVVAALEEDFWGDGRLAGEIIVAISHAEEVWCEEMVGRDWLKPVGMSTPSRFDDPPTES